MYSALPDNTPIPVTFLVIASFILVSNEIGYRIGIRAREGSYKELLALQGPLVGGLLGMLAFMLAFTFSIAASLHDQRRVNVVLEANIIGTAYLRADLLKPQQRDNVKKLLREYTDLRLRGATDEAYLNIALKRSLEIHKLLWNEVLSASKKPSVNTSLVAQSINALIDMHEKRISDGVRARIPISIWYALLIISAFTMIAIGIQVGLSGARRVLAILPLSLAFAVLVTLVVDLDRPQKGLLTVKQKAMEDVRATMQVDEK